MTIRVDIHSTTNDRCINLQQKQSVRSRIAAIDGRQLADLTLYPEIQYNAVVNSPMFVENTVAKALIESTGNIFTARMFFR